TSSLVNRPSILKSCLVPARIAPGNTAVTSSHFGLEQELAAGGNLAQLSNPLRWFHVQHTCVIERGHSQNIGIILRRDILIGRVGCHVVIDFRALSSVATM